MRGRVGVLLVGHHPVRRVGSDRRLKMNGLNLLWTVLALVVIVLLIVYLVNAIS